MGTPPQHSTCTTADPDAAAEFFRSAWGAQGRIDGLHPDHPIRMSRMAIGHACVTTATLPSALEFETESWPCYLVTQLKSGSLQIGATARPQRCTSGDAVLAVRPGRPCWAQTVDAEVSLATLAPEALLRITGDSDADGGPAVRFMSGRPRSAAAAGQWATAVDYVTATLQGTLDTSDVALVVGGAISLLASTMLHVFPNTYADAERSTQPDVSAPLLRQAIDYIHDNCARDIAMADVATAIDVTPRAVQYMFRRHLDTTPIAYLRHVRLERAHRDLLAADPSRDTVAAIATRWGFAHTGRFSQAYRAEFGEAPSVTLYS
ncbi:AraC-like DNA-binding protein [Mycolicibacterium sp. BK634]|uniref:helix-turn-helix domain-containing protein n=1 Tax=Mycobacteriaceae TaxID=1762 RepID=UPI0010D97E55|nr:MULTISPECIES: AraC family transcriptional regulator [Mycobacteriaceae]MBB3749803.1 AraC-like DNA-binding protein [Mycolicibacterium sp. BK634]TDO18910.1 AraC-like protein [Mycobacterium sp. BK086]